MIRYWGLTDKGAVRADNQDSFCLQAMGENQLAAVVCDGMGGAKAGNVASSLTVQTVRTYLRFGCFGQVFEQPEKCLSRAASLANCVVFRRSLHDMACCGMGTTLVAALVEDGKAKIMNIGDSRAYLINKEGIRRITRDHSVVEDLVERGEITEEQARNHPQKNLITRCIGTASKVEGDFFDVELHSGDILLLCTDGLSNTLTDQELLYEAMHGGAAEGCCERMLQAALDRGALDNVTAVLVEMV